MQLFLLDHIPPPALTRMAMCLLEGTASEQTLNMCKVIVHFKAGLSLYASQLHSPKEAMIREHVKEMQLRHLNAALTALDAVSVMARPSLLLLQALLTGVSMIPFWDQSVETHLKVDKLNNLPPTVAAFRFLRYYAPRKGA
jgi:hypothetical protein